MGEHNEFLIDEIKFFRALFYSLVMDFYDIPQEFGDDIESIREKINGAEDKAVAYRSLNNIGTYI